MSDRKPSQRFHSLNTEQVEVLHQVLSEVVPIHGRGNFPTLELRPRDIIITVRARLQKQGITVRDVRLNGSTASHVLVRDNGTSCKDLDIIFGVELPTQEEFQVIKESVLGCLLDCLPAGVNRERISSATMKEAYVQKMVKVFNDHDRWSLISLSNNSGKNLELKFVSALRRQFEFSVDSFQIILDRLLESYMQQELQHKMKTNELKDSPVEGKDPAPETEKSSPGRDLVSKQGAQISQLQQRDEKESQTEISQQSEHFNQTKHSTLETENKAETPTDMKGDSEHREGLEETDQTSLNVLSEEKPTCDSAEPPVQTELTHEPEPLDETKCSLEAEQSEEMKPSNGQQPTHLDPKEVSDENELANHTNPPDEQKELAEQMEQAEMPKTSNKSQTAEPHGTEQSEKTNLPICLGDDQSSNEEDEIQHVSADGSLFAVTESQSADEREAETETSEDTQAGSQSDTGTDEIIQEISASEIKYAEDTQGINGSSSTLTVCNTQDTLETHSTQDTDESEKPSDALSPSNTQDVLPAPPSPVADQKTSSSSSCSTSPPSSKASERLSHMVVLKHSSPKPPRRMCRKVTPSLHPSPVSESELAPFLDPNPNLESDLAFDPNPTPQSITDPLWSETNSGLEHDPSEDPSSNLDFTSAPDPDPDMVSTSAVELMSALPQEPASQLISEGPCETSTPSLEDTSITNVAFNEQSHSIPRENVTGPKQSEPPDSGDSLVSNTDTFSSDTQEPAHTSEDDLSEEPENITDLETKTLDLHEANINSQENEFNSLSFSHCFTPPVVSLSPPCLTPSPQSLSPPPCLTPPSHSVSSPMLSAVSSPPRSFSPTSSCLSSPPYLTPPMLSLSPPPLCLTPPSPCLSPPLLCLTPPVESEDLIPQVSSDVKPLILNTDSDEQIKESSPQTVPLLQLEDEKEQDYIASLPQVAEPVSFPITIPSSTSHVLPHSEPGGSGETVPPKVAEASNSVLENKDAPRECKNVSGQCNTPQATGSVPDVEVLAESMYGDFEAAMDHLRYRLIATRNPEEIRGGGLLKYSNLLVRDYRPASETQIKTLERYMCSRFFIDFPDVQEQQRKILSYLKNHFIGEERNKYQYLMTLRRVVDDSTVCLMGHERRQTLNMITVLALKVLGEQNIIPNTDHVTCFYQPAPYLAEHSAPYLPEPSYCSYYIPQGGSTLLYQPYPLHLHPQTGLV